MTLPARGPPDQAEHEQREEKRAGVDEHVRRVGEECERVGQDAGDDLADHEGDDQRQAGAEPTRVGALLDDVHVHVARDRAWLEWPWLTRASLRVRAA